MHHSLINLFVYQGVEVTLGAACFRLISAFCARKSSGEVFKLNQMVYVIQSALLVKNFFKNMICATSHHVQHGHKAL